MHECGWGLIVLIFFIIIFMIAGYCTCKDDKELMSNLKTIFDIDKDFLLDAKARKRKIQKKKQAAKNFERKIKRVFKEKFSSLKQQPMVFKKQLLSVPGNCHPYMGCSYPSALSNPINVRTGKRQAPRQKGDCKVSWRDCGIYQNCVDGNCVPKRYP